MHRLLMFPVVLGVLLRSGAADACEITRPEPTDVIPTVPSQPFSFVATTDCTTLSFSGGGIVKTPRPGRMMSPTRRRYTVSLTMAEWNLVASSRAATFVWTVTGRTGTTRPTRATTTNQLDFDADGWTRSEGDLLCDLDDTRNPGTVDVMGNGVDEDCDGRADNTRFDDPAADIRSRLLYPQLGWYPLEVADFDADGIADLAMSTPVGSGREYPGGGTVYVVHGPMSGTILADRETVVTTSSESEYIGQGLGAGDADADGIGDLAPGAAQGDAAYLLLGPLTADRSVSSADAVFVGPAGSGTGVDIDIVSDFDGDGTGDVVIGAPHTGSMDNGVVYVASGGLSGTVTLDTDATYVFSGTESTVVGLDDRPIGDVSGDGIADLALMGNWAVTYLVEGGQPAGSYDVDVAAWASLPVEWSEGLASGDYDGDGTLDLFSGEPHWTREEAAYAFIGPFAGATSTGDATATWTKSEASSLAGAAMTAGDVDADGSLDLLVGAPSAGFSGAVYLQLGFASGVIEIESLPYFSLAEERDLGQQVATLPDWDGDGGVEIATSAPTTSAWSGAVFVFESNALALPCSRAGATSHADRRSR